MSDAVFSEIMTQIDSLSYTQKNQILRAIKRSMRSVFPFSAKKKTHIAESLVGIIPDNDISIEKIREERLKKYESLN